MREGHIIIRDEARIEKIIEDLKKSMQQDNALDIRSAFDKDPDRFDAFSFSFQDLLIDFSKTPINHHSLQLLQALAKACGIEEHRSALFAGQAINITEKRAALHTALRLPKGKDFYVGERNIGQEIQSVHAAMEAFAHKVRDGQKCGLTGKRFEHIVNIGIGGSDLAPAMAVTALQAYQTGPLCHFVANIDPEAMEMCLREIDPETTLFIVASKTFTTIETMRNAALARDFMVERLGKEALKSHFVASTADVEKAHDFGIAREHIFSFWDYVGGRYSLWSAIGLPVMLSIGPEEFFELLAGAHAMDEHFLNAPIENNLPILFALVTYYHQVVCGFSSRVVVPYAHALRNFIPYIQQLEMESNGKSITLQSEKVKTCTSPLVWGDVGTNAQHAFFQLLHQGTIVTPVELLAFAQGHNPALKEQYNMLLAACLAQAQALLQGRDLEQVKALLKKKLPQEECEALAPHLVFEGNRPTIMLLQKALTPFSLGRLLALYEHRVFVEGCLMHINSFDQWGVQLGKEVMGTLLPFFKADAPLDEVDVSVRGVLRYLKAYQEKDPQ